MSTVELEKTAIDEVVGAIQDGTFSPEALKQIERAIAGRRDGMIESWRGALSVGFRVRVIQNISPKYLAGHTGVVERVEGRRFVVRFDHPAYGRRRTWHTANCYPSHLEPEE